MTSKFDIIKQIMSQAYIDHFVEYSQEANDG